MLVIRVTAVGEETTLGRMNRLLEEARASKSDYERLADRVVRYFLPATVLLAVAAGYLGYGRGGADQAVMAALSVLLIACPCALGIATPLAVWIAMGRSAEKGALFRDGSVVERFAAVSTIGLDKTGTLTSGRPSVTGFHTSDRNGHNQIDSPLALAAAVVVGCEHALARSVRAYAVAAGVEGLQPEQTCIMPGRGIAGQVGGRQVHLGSLRYMAESSLTFDEGLASEAGSIIGRGDGITCVGWGGVVRGVFAFSEELRQSSRGAVSELKRLGCEVTVLTGDHEERGRKIGQALGVQVLSQLLPEDKLNWIEQVRGSGKRVAFVGDGINDAPALAAADVGIAMGCGSDLTRESASLCLLGDDLTALPTLLQLARRTVRTVRTNLLWAFGYNFVGIGLAVFGLLNPIVAAGVMVLSSLFVVSNSLRLGMPGTERAA
jgi:heavy metal translocating P-type ATPase